MFATIGSQGAVPEFVFDENTSAPYSEIFFRPPVDKTLVTPPTLIRDSNVAVAYPQELRRQEAVGTVLLWVTVLQDGTVNDVAVAVSSSHAGLDEAAVRHAKAMWRFKPGTIAGRPVTMRALAQHRFAIEELEGELRQKEAAQAQLVQRAMAEQRASLEAMQQQALKEEPSRIAREEPYRLLPSKPLTDAEMAVRAYQVFMHFVYCGDSQYELLSDGRIIQRKRVQFRPARVIALTEVDEANGLEWKGVVAYSYRMGRQSGGKEWDDWSIGEENSDLVYKRNGNWYVRRHSTDYWTPDSLTCAAIP